MKLPNDDCEDDMTTNHKQPYPFLPDRCFRMLLSSRSGCGKTKLVLDLLFQLLYFGKSNLYARNLQQSQYQNLIKTFDSISKEVGDSV